MLMDSASVMRDHKSGLETRIRDLAPRLTLMETLVTILIIFLKGLLGPLTITLKTCFVRSTLSLRHQQTLWRC